MVIYLWSNYSLYFLSLIGRDFHFKISSLWGDFGLSRI